jgi:uncharacterized membrane protein YgaE (UPF0421/DUF939 family)
MNFVKGAQLSVRASVAASLSYALAQASGLEFPLYAFIGAVIVTDLSPAQTRQLGWRRLVATVVGATCGALLSHSLPHGAWAIGSAVLIAMLTCTLVRMQEGAKVAGYTCGIVIISFSAEPWTYAYYRLVETMLGVGVAWAISLVPKLVRIGEPDHVGA